jgi:two-component system, sensor histidine kinase LadS
MRSYRNHAAISADRAPSASSHKCVRCGALALLWAAASSIADIPLQVSILEDPTGTLSISDAVQAADSGRFQPARGVVPNYGYTKSAYWARLSVAGADTTVGSSRTYVLSLDAPRLDSIALYIPDSAGLWETRLTGDHYPFHQREFDNRFFAFSVRESQLTHRPLFLRVRTQGAVTIPLSLQRTERYSSSCLAEQLTLGLYYGTMVVMGLYNLFLFAAIRDRRYLYYVCYVLSLGLFQFVIDGLAYQYLWPDSPWWGNRSTPFMIVMASYWALQFSSSFLSLRTTLPRYSRAVDGLKIAFALEMVYSLVGDYSTATRLATFSAIVLAAVIMVAGVSTLRRGYRAARYFLLAWVLLLAGIVVYALMTFGVLPVAYYTEHSIQIGSVLELALLSLALADQFNHMKRDREVALELQLEESRKLAALSTTFEKYVPHEFIGELDRKSIVEVSLGDQIEKRMSVLFADIWSFATLSETMTPAQNFDFLNSYLRRMEPLIQQHHGFIDKYVGDAIMALFSGMADDAVSAAVHMQNALLVYNAHRRQSGYAPVRIGVGINTGPLILGIIGSPSRMDGTVIGDSVNVASRLERLTRVYKVGVVIGESTFADLSAPDQFNIRPIDCVAVKGRNAPVTVYEVYDADPPELRALKNESRGLFLDALEQLEQEEFETAGSMFEDIAERNPDDTAALYHAVRCRQAVLELNQEP